MYRVFQKNLLFISQNLQTTAVRIPKQDRWEPRKGSVAATVPDGADVTQCVVGGDTEASRKRLLNDVNANITGVVMLNVKRVKKRFI